MEQSRREALKKGAAGAAVLWAAPAVTTFGRAQAAVSPPPGCACTASGFALLATGTILGVSVDVGPVSGPAVVNVAGLVVAELLAVELDDCSAGSEVTSLQVNVPGILTVAASVLRADIDAPCDCRPGSGSSSIAGLTVNGTDLLVSVTGAPNEVLLDAGGIRVVVNEQLCDGGAGVVRALHLTANIVDPILGTPLVTLDLIVAEARAGVAGCPCPLLP